MAAGNFDKRVSIQSTSGVRDAHGQVGSTWSEDTHRWASIDDSGGTELRRARHVNAEVSAVIVLRDGFSTLTPKHRISFGSRLFNITAILGVDDRTPRRGQIIHATEAV